MILFPACSGNTDSTSKRLYESPLNMKTIPDQLKVIAPTGNLDINTSDAFRRQITDLMSTGAKAILIDCQAVTFMDSSGLSALVMALKSAREIGSKLSICSVNDQVRMLFRLTGMEKVFEIFSDRAEFEQVIFSN